MYVVKKGKPWTILGCPNKRAPDVVVLMERKCSSTVRFWGTVLSFFHTNPFRRPKNGILLQISQVLFAPTTKKMLCGDYIAQTKNNCKQVNRTNPTIRTIVSTSLASPKTTQSMFILLGGAS